MRRAVSAMVAISLLSTTALAATAPPIVPTANGPTQAIPVTPYDASGNIISGGGGGGSAPYVFTSTGYQQLTGVSTATGFTPPALSTTCYVTSETVSVRYRTDGTNPTASVGVLLAANQQLILTASLSTVKFIPTSGSTILDVDCYK